MEMCDRKYMFGEKSAFGSSQNDQNMPKKGSTRKNIFLNIKQGSIIHTFNGKEITFYILLEIRG